MKPTSIILHHSLTRDSGSVSWSAIRRYHVHHLGWRDIGYHAGIELVGDRYEILMGRMFNEQGAHTSGHNRGSLGICLLGNFDEHEVPIKQWELGIRFITSLCDTLHIMPDKIYGHSDFNDHKTCPGTRFDIYKFIHQVSERSNP